MISSGKQATYFDNQAMISIGGRGPGFEKRRRKRAPVEPAFEGMLSGLSYNDIRVLDIAASNDSRVQISGNVVRVDPTNMIYGTPIPFITGATRKTPVVRKPSSTANTDLTSPTKVSGLRNCNKGWCISFPTKILFDHFKPSREMAYLVVQRNA